MVTYIGTSWKMTKTLAEARRYAQALAAASVDTASVQPFVLPPATALASVADILRPYPDLWVGAQNAHWAEHGAYTGEVSMTQVKDAGATIVEIGHSERRRGFSETDEWVAQKVARAVSVGLRPLVCIGESESVRAWGGQEAFVLAQAEAALSCVGEDAHGQVILAYEPEWAIGADGRPAAPEEAAGVLHGLAERFPGVAGVLYGGSVSVATMSDYLDLDGCSGVFVGRAAWTVEGFVEMLRSAAVS